MHPGSTDEISPDADAAAEVTRRASDRRERARISAIAVTAIVGSTLIFKMTPLLETVLNIPSPALYGLTGAVFGAIVGAVQRADELEDRIMHSMIGAIILALLFLVFSLGGPHPRTSRWS
ncbi:MAG: hypothetical protein ABI120_19740 [Gemmatimonadaceae bacterium]